MQSSYTGPLSVLLPSRRDWPRGKVHQASAVLHLRRPLLLQSLVLVLPDPSPIPAWALNQLTADGGWDEPKGQLCTAVGPRPWVSLDRPRRALA